MTISSAQKISYLFAGTGGDIAADAATLARPFLLSPTSQHLFLSLGHYFAGLEHFILRENGGQLEQVLRLHFPQFPGVEQIEQVLIRSEKHGAMYHIASIELRAGGSSCKLAVTSALGQSNRQQLEAEFARLDQLHQHFALPYLPRVYFCDEEQLQTPAGVETFTMVLGEWLDGYHEWHLTLAEGRQQVCLWDNAEGRRLLSESEAGEIIRQAARILTLYYDLASGAQIAPWHHAAGDFIARRREDGIDLKLITARGYEPSPGFSPAEGMGPEISLMVFFLNLMLRLRLDRLDGVSAVAWFADFAVPAAVGGFLEALTALETAGRMERGFAGSFLATLRSFTAEDLAEIYAKLLAGNGWEDDEERSVVAARLPAHCRLLAQVLQHIESIKQYLVKLDRPSAWELGKQT